MWHGVPVVWWVLAVVTAFALPALTGIKVSKDKELLRDALVSQGLAKRNSTLQWKTGHSSQLAEANRAIPKWKTRGYLAGGCASIVVALFFPFVYFLLS